MGILDIYEWFRPTKSNKKSEKPIERKYDFECGFTGDRKQDMNSSAHENKKEENNSRDGREMEI